MCNVFKTLFATCKLNAFYKREWGKKIGCTISRYIVGCRSDYRDNLILSFPVVRNKTFDGVVKFYYYCKLGYINRV